MPRLRYLISEDRKIADPNLQSFDGAGYHPAANFKSNWTKCISVGEEDVDNTLENAKRLGLGLWGHAKQDQHQVKQWPTFNRSHCQEPI
jgi:hypothetical protein